MIPAAVTVLLGSGFVLVGALGRVFELLQDPAWSNRITAISPILLVLLSAAAIYFDRRRTPTESFASGALRDREFQWGLAVVAAMCLLALYAPLLTPHDPEFALYGRLRAPSFDHPLGTDTNGRDFFSRLVYGARLSLQVGVGATAIAIALGILVGVTSALAGGRTDTVLMRTVDAGLAFPRVFLLLALIALLPTVSQPLLIIVLGCTSWFDIARLVRGEVLSLRRVEYIVATSGLGLPVSRVVTAHVLPNIAGPVIVSTALSIGYMILLESGLSYLGVGTSAAAPSWGRLIQEGYGVLRDAPLLTLLPGAMIALTVIGFSLIGDGLRQSLDPHRS